MRPVLALNCLLQIDLEKSEEESSVGNALALAFHCACFCSALLILFALYSPAPLPVRPHHSLYLCSQFPRLCWYVEVFKGGFKVEKLPIKKLPMKPASVAQLDAPYDWRPGGCGLNPCQGWQHSFVEIDQEIFSTVILSLLLNQEGQLSVLGERMCTILFNC